MVITEKSVPSFADGIKTRDEQFGMLLISRRTPILTLNDDSTAIWKKIDGVKNVSSIVRELTTEYDCSEKVLVATVIAFLENCHKLGLITIQ